MLCLTTCSCSSRTNTRASARRTSTDFVEQRLEQLRGEGFPIDVCTQHAGDLLFVPGLWNHATVNLGETIAVAWRERFVESPLHTAATKHQQRLDEGSIVRPTAEDGSPDLGAHTRLVFDL
jgi:hypothetical protein